MSLKKSIKNIAKKFYEPIQNRIKPYYRSKQYKNKWGEDGIKLFNDFFSFDTPGEETSFLIDGYPHKLYLRKGTSDEPTLRQIFMNVRYDMDLPFIPRTILDGGSNVGYASVFFANKYPKSLITAIEPDTSNFSQLIKNTQNYPSITPIQTAIWGKSGYLRIINPETEHWAYEVAECNETDMGAFKALSISEIITDQGWESIDILKLDIEGAEMSVFQKGYEQWLPKVKLLIIELHEKMRPGCTEVFEQAISKYNFEKSISGENLVYINKD